MGKLCLLTLGAASAICILCGIILAVITQQMVNAATDGRSVVNVTSSKMTNVVDRAAGTTWGIGVLFIVPGVFGIVAFQLQNKCLYVTTLVFTLFWLIVMGIICLVAMLALAAVALSGPINERCTDTGQVCRCRNETHPLVYEDTAFKTCEFYGQFINYFTAVLVFVVLAWFAVQVEFVVSCYMSCCASPDPVHAEPNPPKPPTPQA